MIWVVRITNPTTGNYVAHTFPTYAAAYADYYLHTTRFKLLFVEAPIEEDNNA